MIKKYFDIQELVCPHVYERWGDAAWQFFHPTLLQTLLAVREGIGRPIYVNNWQIGGTQTQRGLRCNVCPLVAEKTRLEKVYLSAHIQGLAVDFTVKGMTALQVRNWIAQHPKVLPVPVRLERDVSWVHLDVRDPYTGIGQQAPKVSYFSA